MELNTSFCLHTISWNGSVQLAGTLIHLKRIRTSYHGVIAKIIIKLRLKDLMEHITVNEANERTVTRQG